MRLVKLTRGRGMMYNSDMKKENYNKCAICLYIKKDQDRKK